MVGYLPDTFGHTAQLPQILRGFGIDNFFFMRGLGDEEDELGTEFLWEAPDGSRVLAIYFREGFCNANMLGLPPLMPIVWRAPEGWYTIFHGLYFEEPKPDFKSAESKVIKLAKTLLPLTRSGTLLLMNGCDHQPPQSNIVEVIEYLNSSNLNMEFIHGSLKDYLDIVRQSAGELRIYKGELRGAKRHPILANVLSTRAYLKKLNYRAQVLLEKYAEPLSVFAMLIGRPYPSELLLLAWKLLLQNHAHDSIYGSGSDPVHTDNESRFYQVISVASNIAYEAGCAVARLCKCEGSQLSVFVYNPSSLPRTDVVLVPLPVSEVEQGLVAVDDEGRRLPVQLLDRGPLWRGVCLAAFVADHVPSMGYRVYKLERDDASLVRRDNGCMIENEYFRVEADPERGGSLRLVDKETGLIYEGLNVFVDEGDAGDEYNYSPPKNGDLVIVSTSFKARVEREIGPAISVLRISLEMEVPERLEGQARSHRTIRMPIMSEIFLYRGIRRVDIRTTVDNRATDHRLRVRFPVGIHTDKAAADSHFYVVERSVKPESDGKGWIEVPPTTHPQLYWVDISDESRGFMVANRGIPEYEVREENGGLTIYLTLFRSVGWLSRDDLKTRRGHAGPPIPTPGAQCLRRMIFEYSLIPHQGTWFSSRSYLEARNFAEPLMAIALPGLTPSSKAFVSVEPETLIVTALKKAEDSDFIVLRFYNIAGERVTGIVRLGFKCKGVWRANLGERPLKKIGGGNTIKVDVKPYEIVTLLIEP